MQDKKKESAEWKRKSKLPWIRTYEVNNFLSELIGLLVSSKATRKLQPNTFFLSCHYVHKLICVFCLLEISAKAFKCAWEQIAVLWAGRESSECWFCMMSCTLIGLTKYHIYFTCGLQGKKVWLLESRTPTPRMVSWACHKWPLSGQPEALLTVTPKTKEKRLSPLLLSQNYPNLSSQLDFPHILNTHTRTHTHFIQGVSAAYLPLVQLKFCKLPTCPFIFELAFLQNLLQLKSHTIPIWKGTLSEQQES